MFQQIFLVLCIINFSKSDQEKVMQGGEVIQQVVDTTGQVLKAIDEFKGITVQLHLIVIFRHLDNKMCLQDTVGKFAGFIGPIGAGIGAGLSLISMFLPEQKSPIELKLDQVLEKLKAMHEEMNARLTNIAELITSQDAKDVVAQYKKVVRGGMSKLISHYDLFLETQKNSALEHFKKECAQRDTDPKHLMLDLRHQSVDGFGAGTLMKAIYDLQFNKDSKMLSQMYACVASDTMKLLELVAVCSNISNQPEEYFDIASKYHLGCDIS